MSGQASKAAAAYVRMSTEHQRYSIANQLAVIEAFCEANDLSLVRIYTDAGKSGLTIAGRPGLQSLIADARAGGLPFESILVLDVSRWGRFQNVDEAAWLEHLMKRAGAPVVYCAEAFENDDSPAASMVKAIKRAMAAEYSRELSRKVAQGSRRVAADGWRPGSVPGYGYRRVIVNDAGKVLQDAGPGDRKALFNGRTTLRLGPAAEVAAIRRVFYLYVRRRLSCEKIAALIVAENWPPPTPRTFCAGWVGCILRNEKYAGTLIYGRMPNPLGTGVIPARQEDWIVVHNAHPAIISMRLFKAAQTQRKRRYTPVSNEALIIGLERLHARYGFVSSSLIAGSRAVPPVSRFQGAFGSLAAAYRAAGIEDLTLGIKRGAVRRLKAGIAHAAHRA